MIDIALALIVAVCLPFIMIWAVMIGVMITLWMVPFSALCILEVLAMWRDVFNGLLAPVRWVLRLLDRKQHEDNQQFSLARSNLLGGGSDALPGLHHRPAHRGPNHTHASSVLKI